MLYNDTWYCFTGNAGEYGDCNETIGIHAAAVDNQCNDQASGSGTKSKTGKKGKRKVAECEGEGHTLIEDMTTYSQPQFMQLSSSERVTPPQFQSQQPNTVVNESMSPRTKKILARLSTLV